jgi:hypothetical protein
LEAGRELQAEARECDWRMLQARKGRGWVLARTGTGERRRGSARRVLCEKRSVNVTIAITPGSTRDATHLVGAMTIAATSPFLYCFSFRTSLSSTGTTNASVLPEPVTAYPASARLHPCPGTSSAESLISADSPDPPRRRNPGSSSRGGSYQPGRASCC